ncbi:MAG: hypothetical protein K2X72_06655 [Reyranella sp.]|nr:hypothetical protein [Reyranella sp.]
MQVSVAFLGRTRVVSDGRELALSRQNLSFLAYLVLHRDVDHPRETLIEQFWSDCDPARGRSCLGSALLRLRKALTIDGSDWLEVTARGEPRISSSALAWFDIVTFEQALVAALSAPAGKIETPVFENLMGGLIQYRGDLLPGWYDDWVLAERERLRLLCLRGYRRLMDHYVADGDTESALAAGLEALRIEPLQELVQQQVIELYYYSGQRVAAIRQYEKLAALLKAELDIAPSKNTRALIERIRSDRSSS